jgi:hypothetical protein
MPANFITELEADAEALEFAIARKIENRRAHVTATAVLGRLCERGMKALRKLDPYIRNTFAADSGKLAAWRSASRVERRSARARKDEQPSAPPSSPEPTLAD